MPAPLADVDWHEVKTLAIAIGNVREAARQMGVNEESAKARSRRDGWLAPKHEARASLSTEGRQRAMKVLAPDAPIRPTAAEILSGLGTSTKAHMASAADRAARRFSAMPGTELVQPEVAGAAKAWTGTAAMLHGWKDGQSGAPVTVNIGIAGYDAVAVQVPDAEALPVSTGLIQDTPE